MTRSNLTQPLSQHRSWLIPVALTVALLSLGLFVFVPAASLPSHPRQAAPGGHSSATSGPTTDSHSIEDGAADTRIVEARRVPQKNARTEEQRSVTAPAVPAIDDDHRSISLNLALLERGFQQLSRTVDYTAIFSKQERIKGELWDKHVMQLKLRHEPFSIYMKTLVGDPGREVLYVAGQNENKLLFHPGGWKALLLPILKLDPHGMLALSENRYPITKVGILELTRELIGYRRRDLVSKPEIRCHLDEDDAWDGRDCFRFDIEYKHQSDSKVYRRSIQYIDKELCLPIRIENFTWCPANQQVADEDLDALTMIEHYAYSKLKLNASLPEASFNKDNSEYKFHR